MKKLIAILLSMILAITLFAACNNTKDDPSVTEDANSTVAAGADGDTTEEGDAVITEPATEEPTTEEPTTEEPTTAEADADPLVAPANLGSLSNAEQLEYFNAVVNNVRTEKPGFKKDSLLKIDKISLSGAAGVANGIIEMVKNKLMPGEWTYETKTKGSGNVGTFLSENANASDLRASDVASITSTKSGDGWTIKVNIIKETNPGKGTSSAHSRLMGILTRKEVLDEITNISDAISADPNNATLNYHSGYATVTVNAKGQVTSGGHGFQVAAIANDVKISIIKTNVTAPQSTEIKYHSFVW